MVYFLWYSFWEVVIDFELQTLIRPPHAAPHISHRARNHQH